MLQDSKPYTFDRVIRITLTVGLLCGLVWLLGYLSDVLIPFAVALLLAYLINPLVVLVEKKVKNRTAAVLLSLILIAVMAVSLGGLIIPMMVGEIAQMGRVLSEVANNSDLAERAAKFLPPDLWQALKDYAANKEVQDFFKTDSFWKIGKIAAQKILPGVWGLITGTASLLMGLVGLSVIGLYLVFLLMDYKKMSEEWKDLLPTAVRDHITGFTQEFESAMSRYFRGQAAVASIVGVLFATGFWLIGLPMGILLGLFIGLLNMVPYLQLIGLIPAFLFALVHALETGTGVLGVLGLTALVFVIVQLIQDTVLTPKIMGKVTGLNPAMILLSLSIWGKLLGVFGLIIALPMTCLFLAYYKSLLLSAASEDIPLTQETG
jgi:predicted PurR-regulated permease PerM